MVTNINVIFFFWTNECVCICFDEEGNMRSEDTDLIVTFVLTVWNEQAAGT